ncbi:MAG: helix-turn-helix transcriptional regulator [Oscillospiraceae bacterium]|jgi:putative transcriptional regulator|nr:helix-turn-helix transcriptional regulator [Oscillospiraceae bacterium]
MIKLRVTELLERHGKTKYWLYRQLGMSYQNFSRMINNQTRSIRYENIETLCVIFSVTPNELFEYDFDVIEEKVLSDR